MNSVGVGVGVGVNVAAAIDVAGVACRCTVGLRVGQFRK